MGDNRFDGSLPWGLSRHGNIIRIELWSTTLDRQELHFHIRKKGYWSYYDNFVMFARTKKEVQKFKKTERWQSGL